MEVKFRLFSVYLDFFSRSFRFCVRSKWQVWNLNTGPLTCPSYAQPSGLSGASVNRRENPLRDGGSALTAIPALVVESFFDFVFVNIRFISVFSWCCYCVSSQEFAPSDDELLAYRRGEEWDPEKAKELAKQRVCPPQNLVL